MLATAKFNSVQPKKPFTADATREAKFSEQSGHELDDPQYSLLGLQFPGFLELQEFLSLHHTALQSSLAAVEGSHNACYLLRSP